MDRASALENTAYLSIQSSKTALRHPLSLQERIGGDARRLESCLAVVCLNNIVLCSTTMIHATRDLSATWKRFDISVTSKGDEIRDVWHRQAHRRGLRLLEPFIGVVGFDYVITLKFQHFS
jgi:hypothetical protein